MIDSPKMNPRAGVARGGLTESAARENLSPGFTASVEASPGIKKLRYLLLLLVFVLTFEGVTRKLAGSWTKIPLFFLKDFLVALMGLSLSKLRRPPAIEFLWTAYGVLAVLMSPLILFTAVHDPVLAVFGAKQYLLFPIVGLATFTAFETASRDEVSGFFKLLALLIVPTCAVALLQLRLPADHWINLSVDGASLEDFSAAGRLRVSSTFAFCAQYCYFLNSEIYILLAAITLKGEKKGVLRIALFSLIPFLVVSNYVTGSRSAVVGSIGVIVVGAAFSAFKFRTVVLIRSLAICAALYFSAGVMQHFFPDAFEAYSERQGGNLTGTGTEVNQRVVAGLIGWMGASSDSPIIGHGLGVMSNGVETLSKYAGSFRKDGNWTETDYATTFFEGGLYFVMIWYGFRYFVIYQTALRFFKGVRGEFETGAAFCQGYIVVFGVMGTLGIQPPLSIWWWLAVGSSLVFWWKSVEPGRVAEAASGVAAAPPVHKVRGRSFYSERLRGPVRKETGEGK